MSLDFSELPCQPLRQRAAVNFFKLLVLERSHIPDDPQEVEIKKLLHDTRIKKPLDMRTWRHWFGDRPRNAKVAAIGQLDRYVDLVVDTKKPISLYPKPPVPTNYFQLLLGGGLVQELLQPTESKHLENELWNRARHYHHRSNLHLHLDAIEVTALAHGYGNVSWETVKKIAAQKVMELITERWSTRGGTMYSGYAPVIKQKWCSEVGVPDNPEDELTDPMLVIANRTVEIKPQSPDFFDRPIYNDAAVTQVHRLLISLLIHQDYLVGDRFGEWVLDLVSAALALHSLAWIDRYKMFASFSPEPEAYYCRILRKLFFDDDPPSDRDLLELVDLHGIRPEKNDVIFLLNARKWYHWFLRQLGLTPAEVEEAAHHCSRIQPIAFDE